MPTGLETERAGHIFRSRSFLLALDHGLLAGPLPGLEDPRTLLHSLRHAPLTGVIANPGLVRSLAHAGIPGALVVHLSAGTVLGSRSTSKALAAKPGAARALGADAVSVQVHFGDSSEDRMLADLGAVSDAARSLGLEVLAMAYPPKRGDPLPEGADLVHAVRAAVELGADAVQVADPGPAAIRAAVRGCPVPLLVAGGPRAPSPQAWLDSIREAMRAGAAGLSAGRNLFQHPDPEAFAQAIGEIVFGA